MSKDKDLEGMSFKELYQKLTKRWLTPKELENEYGFSISSQAKMRMNINKSSTSIPFSKVGKYIRYDRVAIDQWLENHAI